MKFQTLYVADWLANKNGTKRNLFFIVYVSYDRFFSLQSLLKTGTFTMHDGVLKKKKTFTN